MKKIVISSENNKIPIEVANITLKKSKGITVVVSASLNPFIVKYCASKPKIVIKIMIANDTRLGSVKNFAYGNISKIQLNK